MSRLRGLLRTYPLTSFFGLAYALTWLACLPHILWVWGLTPTDFLPGFLLKQWVGPAAAAMIMAAVLGGRSGVRELRARGRQWRAHPAWYLVTLAGPPVLILLGVLPVTGTGALSRLLDPTLAGPTLGYFVLVFIAVGLPEELGWRGFALPRLQERLGPWRGTLLLGVLWAGWHLPFFLTSDHGGGPGTDPLAVAASLAVFSAMVVSMAILFTFVFNRTGGSVFLVALLHTAIDTPQAAWLPVLLPVGLENSTRGEFALDLALLCTFGAAALVVAVATRGRLGLADSHVPVGAGKPAQPVR